MGLLKVRAGIDLYGMSVWEFLFPTKCVGCGVRRSFVCGECVDKLQPRQEMICPQCGKGSIGGLVHARCKTAWGMDGLVAGMKYRGLMQKVIGKFKYRYVSTLSDVVVEILFSLGGLERLPEIGWMVVPVPLHARRQKWRGFNQAELLAEKIADELGCSFAKGVLVRTKYTQSQMKLTRQQRLENLVGAFGKGSNFSNLNGKSVLLVDDVWTTGATMRECTKVLKRGGVKEVWGVVVAR